MGGISLIIDANLLVLFVVGTTNRSLIARHKRLKAFSLDDFDMLCRLVESAPEVLVTPNALTEASNLLGYIGEPARTQVFKTFRTIVQSTPEEYVQSRIACKTKEFLRLGLTDAALMELSNESRLILTTDLDLYLAAQKRGVSAINFNHLRQPLTT